MTMIDACKTRQKMIGMVIDDQVSARKPHKSQLMLQSAPEGGGGRPVGNNGFSWTKCEALWSHSSKSPEKRQFE
jgi:hypothetical protein